MSQLSPHFQLEEFERSATATRLGICNAAPLAVITCLQNLCQQILEPARQAYGKPIVIQSGYRCTQLNQAVGGVPNSQHRTGEAADLPYSATLLAILKTLPYDQLIVEVSKSYKASGGTRSSCAPVGAQASKLGAKWLHVSCKFKGQNRHQFIATLVKK